MISLWLAGKRAVSSEYSQRLSSKLNISKQWIETGIGDMKIATETDFVEFRYTGEKMNDNVPEFDDTESRVKKSAPLFSISVDAKTGFAELQPNGNRRLSIGRKPVIGEIGIKLPWAIPHTSFKKNSNASCDECEINDVTNGDVYLVICEIGVLISPILILNDGRFLMFKPDDCSYYVPKNIMRIFHVLQWGQNPYEEVEFTNEEKAKFAELVRDFNNREKSGKIAHRKLQVITFSLIGFPVLTNAGRIILGHLTPLDYAILFSLSFIGCLIGDQKVNPLRRKLLENSAYW